MRSTRGKIEPLYPEDLSPQEIASAPSKKSPIADVEIDTACHISIYCSKPAEDGRMRVTMEYTGDVELASFLIRHAQEIIEEQAQK